ncbi:MAG TPA: hypothetical protein VLV15_05620, partial [Dongiaceae bacterium]|nr:hypothetical protein [Dongiaceae bacterium]
MRDVLPGTRWIALVGAFAMAGQTIWTTRQGRVYRGRTEFVTKANDPARYRFWVGVQWLLVATL